jgi:hypothetical protein
MSGVLYVRDVDDAVIETLKNRAAEARMSLSSYVAAQLTTIASRPTNAELLRRARRRLEQVGDAVSIADIVDVVRADRDRDHPDEQR